MFTSRLGTDLSILGGGMVLGGEDSDPLALSVESELAFLDVGYADPIAQMPTHAITFLSTAVATVIHIYSESVSHTLGISDSMVFVGPHYEFVQDTLHFEQTLDGHINPRHLSLTDNLGLRQTIGRVLSQSISDPITFVSTGQRKNICISTLALIQSVTGAHGGDGDQSLSLTDAVSVNGIYRRALTDVLGLSSSVSYLLDTSCTKVSYSPFVGSSSDSDYTPPTTTAPTLATGTLTLTYPYLSPTTTLVLRNPEFGDKDRLNFNRINRETRGGTLIVFADPTWPKYQMLSVQIDALKPDQVEDMITFLALSLGKEIGLLDWEGRQWHGIIVTPDAQFTHVGKNDRSVTFEFQGALA